MPKYRTKLIIGQNRGFIGGDNYSCNFCDYIASNDLQMRLHLKMSHDYIRGPKKIEIPDLSRCAICGKMSRRNKICCITPRR